MAEHDASFRIACRVRAFLGWIEKLVSPIGLIGGLAGVRAREQCQRERGEDLPHRDHLPDIGVQCGQPASGRLLVRAILTLTPHDPPPSPAPRFLGQVRPGSGVLVDLAGRAYAVGNRRSRWCACGCPEMVGLLWTSVA